MNQSLAMGRIEFQHNDVESFRSTLLSILDSQYLIKQGKRSVIIAVESVYSMDGDVCPLQELVDVTKEIFPRGNAQFVVDEAHSTGVIGSKGAGLVCELGLEKEIAVRLHTYGKAMSASGGMIALIYTFANLLLTLLSSYHTRQQNDQSCVSKLCAVYYNLYSTFVSIRRCNSSRIQPAERGSDTRGKLSFPQVEILTLLLGSRPSPRSCSTLFPDNNFAPDLGKSARRRTSCHSSHQRLGRTAVRDAHCPDSDQATIQLLAFLPFKLFRLLCLPGGLSHRA